LKKEIDSRYLKKWSHIALGFLAAFALYALSVGPVLKICRVRASTGFARCPKFVQVVYYPLFNSNVEFLNAALDHYVQFWIGKD